MSGRGFTFVLSGVRDAIPRLDWLRFRRGVGMSRPHVTVVERKSELRVGIVVAGGVSLGTFCAVVSRKL